MSNEVAVTSSTGLGSWTSWALKEVSADFSAGMIVFDDYAKKCAMDAMSAIYQLVQNTDKADLSAIDTSNLRDIVKKCASLKLSASSVPREVYFQLRNKLVNGQWVKEVEMGIEGDGNDALLRNFGVGVENVYSPWLVCEGDEFEYPKRKGLKIEPPSWEPKGLSNKVIRVVYPIKLKGNKEEYLISERDSVKVNFLAHIRQNLLNETFGIVSKKKDANAAQAAEIKAKKDAILNAIRQCETIDEMVNCDVAKPYMSAAWLDSTEAMIVRKMRNNATKKFPKAMNQIASTSFMQMDDSYIEAQAEISDGENATPFLIESS